MNSELQKDWNDLISDYSTRSEMYITKQGRALLAADELLKAQQAHIERLRSVIINATNNGAQLDNGCWVYAIDDSVLAETPAQSLEALNKDHSND